ncbi:hypothetical protein HG536_0A09420 [Torulaspora globosa]|uniref:Uncharacterized protein n=1 Tax=Torulaspora globosa TaxID=48254 RepID=A0A7G3ZC89_9SACH|nr:uncharacterized protein HG536_0A09420 [Torulaspora globosa]QLL31125.1 hypothetical protein HG536_0A09420 [Torulaspora globosa]
MLYLAIEATMSDNIKQIYPEDTEQDAAQYTFDLVCTHCREQHSSSVGMNRFEKTEMPGSRGEASFVMRCKFCGSDCSINISSFEQYLYNPAEADPGQIQKMKDIRKKNGIKNVPSESCVLLSLDCRGCEVTQFHPENLNFNAELTSGKQMTFELEDGREWYDYDDDSNEEVTVTDFRGTIIKGK